MRIEHAWNGKDQNHLKSWELFLFVQLSENSAESWHSAFKVRRLQGGAGDWWLKQTFYQLWGEVGVGVDELFMPLAEPGMTESDSGRKRTLNIIITWEPILRMLWSWGLLSWSGPARSFGDLAHLLGDCRQTCGNDDDNEVVGVDDDDEEHDDDVHLAMIHSMISSS